MTTDLDTSIIVFGGSRLDGEVYDESLYGIAFAKVLYFDDTHDYYLNGARKMHTYA